MAKMIQLIVLEKKEGNIVIVLIMMNFQGVSASGYFTIKLLSFNNPGGKDASGRDCDGRFSGTKCDHYFKVCIDEASG